MPRSFAAGRSLLTVGLHQPPNELAEERFAEQLLTEALALLVEGGLTLALDGAAAFDSASLT